MTHGDASGNTIMTASGPVLIDLDGLAWGPPERDHAAMLAFDSRYTGGPGTYAAFAAGYGADLSIEAEP